ncbi:MAG: PstS family phosphate ABC transporter substrate-binding protein [Desulfobulbus sp.]
MLKQTVSLAAASLLMLGAAQAQAASGGRDYISIVGSSTVYPFSTAVAEQFGKTTAFKTPKIESTGSGGGFKLFCAGSGVDTPDISNASRRIKKSEVENCEKNGVKEIVEIKVGYDGIVLANSKKADQLKLSRKDLYLALAKEVPNPDDPTKFVANPYKTWKEVNAELPDIKIEMLGPPPTSGTRDAFIEMVMEPGCSEFDSIKALEKNDKDKHKATCQTIREDGAYIDAGENDNLIVQKLEANPKAVGIFGFSFLDQNVDKLQGSVIEGSAPVFDSIASGDYKVSRPLFIYVKKAHAGVIPGINEFLAEFTSEAAWGEEGYLAEKGLIPAPKAERKENAQTAKDLKALVLE